MEKKYILGGIIIETEIVFPELIEISGEPDTYIAYGQVPSTLPNATVTLPYFSCNEKDVIFKIDDIAWYYIRNSSQVFISLIDETRGYDAEKYVLTLVLGVLSLKKNYFPLHGGGIIHNGEAYLFTGKSGAGKSTTTLGLYQRGFSTIGDDISNLFIKDSKVYVHPCFPRFKLWEDSIKILQLEGKGAYRLRSNIEKYLVPITGQHSIEPLPVKRIYLLGLSTDNTYTFKTIEGMESFNKIRENIYKPWLVKAFDLLNQHFVLITQLAKNIELKEYRRPFDKNNIKKMYDLLIEDIIQN